MKKILIVTIVEGSAVDRLAEMVQKHNEHFDIEVFPFHAKRHSKNDLIEFEEKAKDADLIDFEYWRGAEVLLKQFPWLRNKKTILTHHNPYDLHKIDIELFDAVVVKNESQQRELSESILIRHSVDMNFFKYFDKYAGEGEDKQPVIGMVAFRIEGKKGIREVAEVCKELDYKFLLVGKISKPEYFKQIVDTGVDLDFREEVSDEELRRAYYEMDVFVCNSIDNFESGPMPVLEAMSCGTPVLTRNIGLIPDLFNNQNLVIRKGATEDKEELKTLLFTMIDNCNWRMQLSDKGWDSLRNYSAYRMAKEYAYLYNKVMFPTKPLVSIITATFDRVQQIIEIMKTLEYQTYKNIEFIVCDDNSTDGTEEEVKSKRGLVSYPVKYVNTNRDGYNLAMARNLGVIEADGEYIMILDSRFLPNNNVVEKFYNSLEGKNVWLFGDKGGNKNTFVENFSFISRNTLIKCGMFNERITEYGGMSQELRERFGKLGIKFIYLPDVLAKEALRTKKKNTRRQEILKMKDLIWKFNIK